MGAAREVVEKLNATINAHDLAAGRALYAEDSRLVPATGVPIDLDGLDAMMSVSIAAMPDLRMEILRVVESGDTVVTEEVMRATHAGTGKPIELGIVHITRVVDGVIVERVAYHDTAAILAQLSG